MLAASLPSDPDIDIRFDTLAGTKPASEGLLERSAASHARAPAIINARFANLRAAPRTIGGLTGDELVERVLEENFAIIYGFRWEVIGTEDNVFVPDVTLHMRTGRGEEVAGAIVAVATRRARAVGQYLVQHPCAAERAAEVRCPGAPKAMQRRATWQLVRLADMPGPDGSGDAGDLSGSERQT